MVKKKASSFDIKPVIKMINKIRKVLDMPPLTDLPKGKKFDCEACPIARALSNKNSPVEVFDHQIQFHNPVIAEKVSKITHTELYLGTGSKLVYHPLLFENFIEEFDAGKIPAYILNRYKKRRC